MVIYHIMGLFFLKIGELSMDSMAGKIWGTPFAIGFEGALRIIYSSCLLQCLCTNNNQRNNLKQGIVTSSV